MVSVIVPVYGVEKYLEPCVRSIMGQSYHDLEIILVDDGSPDRCGEICDTLAAEDSRIRVIHKPNGGLSSARNAGLDVANGEYISFIDSDDLINERFYELLMGQLLEDGSDMAVCGYRRLMPNGSCDEIHIPPGHTVVDEKGYWCLEWEDDFFVNTVCWNKVFRREIWNGISFPIGKLSEDALIINDLVACCERISLIQEPLYVWRIREGSITNTFSFKRYFDAIEACLGRLAYYLDRDYELMAKRVMARCVKYLMIVYRHLKEASVVDAEKYREQREEFKALYRRYSGDHRPPREMRKCALYAFSETAVRCYERLGYWKRKLVR